MLVLIIFTLVSGVAVLAGIALIFLSCLSNDRLNFIIGLGYALLGGVFLALFLSLIM